MSTPSSPSGSEIAVIGMAGRFPGAADVDAFWRNLSRGVESIHRFTDDELARAAEAADLLADPDYVRARPVLDDIDLFDAGFFGFSPQDAAIMDPQHRVFLEVGWEALERAGYDAARVSGQVGVFATCGANSYMTQHVMRDQRIVRTVGEWLVRHTGNDMSFLATGLSYHLDLEGPSMNVQCACSSALVAIHLAAQSLLGGECDMALAGGSVIILPQDRGYLYQTGEIMSRDGHCRPFDADATGTLFGSGAGVVVLKRLADAIDDHDTVLAVIRGSAVNNDGSSKVGFLAPSVEGQSRVIAEALAVSGVEADTISYVEAHGTGTVVGDPIEVTALTDAFRRHTTANGFCRIGSLKSNIGHLGEAAGVAAFIKTVLSLEHEQLPPTLNFERPNPQIDFAASPFVVNHDLTPWRRGASPRRAGVTALGAGGTNCHVIVEEGPIADVLPAGRPEQLLVLSARTKEALAAMRVRLAARLHEENPPRLDDTAFTLQVGRAEFPHRWSAVAGDRNAAVAALRAGGTTTEVRSTTSTVPVVFLFPGGGAQYPNMGRGLYEREPIFRKEVDRCFELLRTRHGIDLAPILFPAATPGADAALSLARPTNSILSVFVVEYALARLWMSWGITPSAMSGHSLGEYVAACLAGVFSVEHALAIVKARGDVFERLPAGSMLSVLLPETEIRPRLTGRLALAAVNAASTCVVSGPVDEIEALDAGLTADGIETQRLHIDVAAHSPMLEPFLDGFRQRLATVDFAAPKIPFVSNLTGRLITAEEAASPDYWVRHLRQTVRFSDGLSTLLTTPDQVLLEVGPGRALTSLARQQPVRPIGFATSLRHPNEALDDVATVMTALGRLWTFGVKPDWSALHGGLPRRRVSLPTYPFEHTRYWIDGETAAASAESQAMQPVAGTTDKRPDMADWFSIPVWRATTRLAAPDSGSEVNALVFADTAGIAMDTIAQLRTYTTGRTWIVEPGPAFSRIDDTRFRINPSNPDDYAALLERLGPAVKDLTHILHAWTLAEPAALEAELERSFFGPMALAQALGTQEVDTPVSLIFVTNGVARIGGETAIVPARATLLGPSRVLPRELTNVSTRIVDVTMPAHAPSRARLARMLALEFTNATAESLLAYRDDTRWAESIDWRRLNPEGTPVLRDQGVYVITGGLGGLGLEIAVHLAETVHARLVLVGRSPLPPRDEWDGWILQHDDHDVTTRRIQGIRRCEAAGAQVMIAVADVADAAQLAGVRKRTIEELGPISGIIHTAGTLDDALMMGKTREAALAVLKPKVLGTEAIRTVFGQDPLDFVVLFSSISSQLGLQGQADYTAANAFLDAVAASAAAEPTRYLSINWGPWNDVGLAVSAARNRRATTGELPAHPWLASKRTGADGNVVFPLVLGRNHQWVVGEHVVRGGDAVLPGTGYLELARAALDDITQGRTTDIVDVMFEAPIVMPADQDVQIELTLTPSNGGYDCVWQNAEGTFATGHVVASDAQPGQALDLAVIRGRCTIRTETPEGFLQQPFMDFGPRWANIQRVDFGQREALVSLSLPSEYADDTKNIRLHPALLDMATGGAQALIPGFDQAAHFYVPFSYGRVRIFQPMPAQVVSHVRLADGTGHDTAVFDVTIATPAGDIVADISAFCMKRVATDTALSGTTVAASQEPGQVRGESAGALADEILQLGLSRQDGLSAFDLALADAAGPQIVVFPSDLLAWRERLRRWGAAQTPSSRSGSDDSLSPDKTGSGSIEDRLEQMWCDLLGVTAVAPEDNFFEVGGHSLLAVRLLSRIKKTFRCSIPLHQLFISGTIAALAALIRETSPDTNTPDSASADVDDDLALTAVPREQMRLSRTDLDRTRGD